MNKFIGPLNTPTAGTNKKRGQKQNCKIKLQNTFTYLIVILRIPFSLLRISECVLAARKLAHDKQAGRLSRGQWKLVKELSKNMLG